MTSYKIYFGAEDIRRITLEAPNWDQLIEQLHKFYPSVYHPELRLQYVDDEGDKITVSSEKEYRSMLEVLKGQPVIKLWIKEGLNEGAYFKDGPDPETREMYVQGLAGEEKQTLELSDVSKTLTVNVPRCLQRLFPGGKLLPYNLPQWLESCTRIKKVEGRTDLVDLDIDIYALFESLHHEALIRIGPEKQREAIEKAKDFLSTMLEIKPSHPIALYNLACAESLLGNVKQAIEALKQAIFDGGYSNIEHLEKDTDLDNVREDPEFVELVLHFKNKQPKEDESIKEFVMIETAKEEPKALKEETIEEEKKTEEPVVEEVKEQLPLLLRHQSAEQSKPVEIPTPYPEQLAQLTAMGFDAAPCVYLLDVHKGKIGKVLHDLLAQTRA